MEEEMSAPNWADEPDLIELRQAYDLMTVDRPQALARLQSLADRGSTMSMLYIAKSYVTADLSKGNLLEAEKWYRRAADQGSDFALYSLGKLYIKMGQTAEAKAIFSSNSLRDYLPAIHELGRMYHYGIGGEKDLRLARSFLEKASAQGHVFAKRELAGLLSGGSFGLAQVPRGLYLFVNSIVDMIRVLKSESQYSEKIS
jgi:TPR repeat protein